MRFLICLFLLLINSKLLSDHHNYIDEIDSLKKIVLSDDVAKNTREYHTTVIDLFRKYRFNEPDSATYYLNYGISISENYKLDLITRDYYNMKGLFYFDKGDFSKALENFYKCLELSVKTNEIGAVGFTYADIGYTFYVQEMWDLALKHYLEGINEIRERDSINTISMPLLYQNTSLTYGFLNKVDSALIYLNMAKEVYEKLDLPVKIQHTYIYMGHIYRRNIKDYDKALEYYKKASDYLNEHRSWHEGYAYSLVHIGEAFFAKTEYDSAIVYFNLAQKEMEELGWVRQKADVRYYISECFLNQNKIEQADSVLLINEKTMQEFESFSLSLNHYYHRYKYYKKLNLLDSALSFYEKYSEQRDSLRKSSITGQVATVLKDMQILKDSKEKELIKEKNIQRIYLLLFILILVIFILLLVYSRMRLQKKSLIILNEKNEELERTNKLLDEANATKDKFFSIIAHDLKNPIGAIKSTSEMLYTDFEMFNNEELKDSINDVYKSSASVQTLLDALLTWSRSQRGKIEFNPETFNLNHLIDNVNQLFKNSIENKNLNFSTNIENNLIISADYNMLNTIIRNLVSNAIKFTPENGDINIDAKKENNNVIIKVSDSGIGISKQDQEKLFNFGTNYSTLGTNNEKGTGLGLILVKEFIDKHKGKIEIESQDGKGTTFIITLPNE